ncbi:MAG TPA: ferrochelatase [Caulobacteraceae bacterium]
MKVAVVLFNLGGPDGPEAVRPFLFNLFNDPAIIRVPGLIRPLIARQISRSREASARLSYDRMGGRSPILPETLAQARALERRLQGLASEVKTFVSMRYWNPFADETAREVEAFAPDEIVLLPLYPQFSTTTTASSLKAWRTAYRGPGRARAVCCYPQAEAFIDAHAKAIEAAWSKAGKPAPVRLLFSAHGLPQKIVDAGDPYQAQVEATAAAVAARLGGGWDWTVCYQSRVGPLKWLGPSTLETIEAAAKAGLGVVISPIAFVSEHLETLVELDHDYAEAAKAMGCTAYVRVPALGDDTGFIEALAQAVEAALSRGPGTETTAGGRWCPGAFAGCPAERKRA